MISRFLARSPRLLYGKLKTLIQAFKFKGSISLDCKMVVTKCRPVSVDLRPREVQNGAQIVAIMAGYFKLVTGND